MILLVARILYHTMILLVARILYHTIGQVVNPELET